jgi:hypothetical protein
MENYMTKLGRYITLAALIFVCWMSAAAQTTFRDALYLKNGSIIKGTIIEFVPDSTVKIRTADSSVFVYPSIEILKITKEEVAVPVGAKPESQTKKNNTLVSIFGGVAIPGGDLGEVAGTGFGFGLQVHSKNKVGVLFNLSYSTNPFSLEGYSGIDESWTSFIILLGLKASIEQKEPGDLYVAPVIGLYLLKISSSSANGFAYGGMMGYQINDRVGVGFRIVAASPTNNGAELSTSMIHIFVAVGL